MKMSKLGIDSHFLYYYLYSWMNTTCCKIMRYFNCWPKKAIRLTINMLQIYFDGLRCLKCYGFYYYFIFLFCCPKIELNNYLLNELTHIFRLIFFFINWIGGSVQTNLKHASQQYLTWIDAANVCFTNTMFPIDYSNAQDVHQQGGSQLWTGMFKTKIVYRHNSCIPGNKLNLFLYYDKELIKKRTINVYFNK
jgi:hypothetical protein